MKGRRQVSRLPRERRVSDIMLAARAVFSTKGYEDALISEIAERAEVVEGSIYRYFENKRDLLIKVVEHWYEEVLSDYDEKLTGIRGTWNRLRFMVWHHLVAIHEEPALCRLVFHVLRPDPAYRSTTVFELNREYTRRTIDIIRDAMDRGEFRPDLPTRIVRDMIYGCVEHHTWAYLQGHGDFSADETADAITDIIYRGLAVAPQSSASSIENVTARLEQIADKFAAATQDVAAKPRKTPRQKR